MPSSRRLQDVCTGEAHSKSFFFLVCICVAHLTHIFFFLFFFWVTFASPFFPFGSHNLLSEDIFFCLSKKKVVDRILECLHYKKNSQKKKKKKKKKTKSMVVQSTRRVSSTRKRKKKATRHSSTRPTHIFFLFNLLVLALEYSNEWKKVSSTRPSTVFFSTFFHSFEYSSARTSKLKRKKKWVGRVLECRVAFFSRFRVLDTLRVLCTTMKEEKT